MLPEKVKQICPFSSRLRLRSGRLLRAPEDRGPNPSLRPLVLAADVPNDTRVRMVVGDQDELLPMTQAYAEALRTRGGDGTVLVAEGLGHNIMATKSVFETLSGLLDEMGPPENP